MREERASHEALIVSDIHAKLEALQAVLAERMTQLWVRATGELRSKSKRGVDLVRLHASLVVKGTTIMPSAADRTRGARTLSARWHAPCGAHRTAPEPEQRGLPAQSAAHRGAHD